MGTPRKIILDKGQSPGDIVVFTGAVRDLKLAYPDWEIDVRSCCNQIFEHNPRLTPLKESAPGVEYYSVGYDDIHNSGWSGRHFSTAYHLQLEKLLGVPVPQTSLLPALYLSDEERSWVNQVEEVYGYRGPFWLINAGHKSDFPLKQWGFDNWQRLVDILKNEVQFVQIGEANPGHFHPDLKGVLSLVGKTDLRQLIRLTWHAQGAACHVTALMHIMAAWEKPCVVVAGGREPRRWEMYPNHRYLDTNGCLPCCRYDGCWQTGRSELEKGEDGIGEFVNKKCKNMVGGGPRCMAMITPERVADEILMYKRGGIVS